MSLEAPTPPTAALTSPAAVPAPAVASLDWLHAQAGGVFAPAPPATGIHPVPVNYGSAAGELAACVSAVGLADRGELVKLVIAGPDPAAAELVSQCAGGTVAVGGALLSGGAWWCGAAPGQTIVLCGRTVGDRLRDQLRARVQRSPTVRIDDHSDDWAAIAVVGRRTAPLLRRLGVYGADGDPRSARPLTACPVDGIAALWLLEADDQALAIVPAADAAPLWRALEQAGRPFGICSVGRDAALRYALIHRARPSL